MKIVKKYTAIKIGTKIVNKTVKPTFEYGEITGTYYDEEGPEEEFGTEEEAIKWAYEESEYDRWLIVPIITFKY